MKCTTGTRRRIILYLSYLCIVVFFSLTTYIVYVYYTILATGALERQEYKKFVLHVIFGNWIAINIYFNYIMAWLTSPGLAKNYQNLATQYRDLFLYVKIQKSKKQRKRNNKEIINEWYLLIAENVP